MKLSTFGELLKDTRIGTCRAECKVIYQLTKGKPHALPDRDDIYELTGAQLIDYIKEVDVQLLHAELNDGLDTVARSERIQDVVDKRTKTSKILRDIIAVGMSTAVGLLTIIISYSIAMGLPLPPPETIVVLFGVPGLVVWRYQGVLVSETKDMILTTLGKTPTGSMVGYIADGLGNRRRQPEYRSYDEGPPPVN